MPHLHLGLGLSNNILDDFNEWLVHQVEKRNDEEKDIFKKYYTCERVYSLYNIEHNRIIDHSDLT